MKRVVILVLGATLAVASVLGANLALGGSPAEEQKTYGPGWLNMAHVGPTQDISQALSSIESNVGVVYYLSPDTGAWLRFVPGKPEVSNLTAMDFGQSYLVLLTAPTTMTVPTEQTFLATSTPCPAGTPCPISTPCPSCDYWQSAAQECLADYQQCVADFGLCVDTLTACLAVGSGDPDVDEVCDLIDDLSWEYDLAVPILDQYSLPWLLLTFAVEDLESWERWNC